jgi:hypothetical protein
MKSFGAAVLVVATALISSIGVAAAQQYGERVPITRNYRGELACPSDYVIQGRSCISIYSPHFRGNYGGALPGPGPVAGPVTQPWVNQNGQLQCPSNYVLDSANNCVSIYARRRYY